MVSEGLYAPAYQEEYEDRRFQIETLEKTDYPLSLQI